MVTLGRPQADLMLESPPRRSLYTVMIVDEGIERLEGKQFIHWLVTNIPGNSISQGQEMAEYVTPFSFDLEGAPFVSGQGVLF